MQEKSRWKIKPKWSTLVMITLIGIVCCGYRLYATRKIAQHLEALRRSSQPISFKEFSKSYPEVPMRENAALVYSAGMGKLMIADSLRLTRIMNEVVDSHPAALAHSNKLFLAGIVSSNRTSLELFHKAALLDKSKYPIKLENGLSVPQSHFDYLYAAAQVLAASALAALDRNDHAEAVRSIDTLLALSRSLASEPLLKSQWVRYFANSLAFECVRELLKSNDLTEGHLLSLQKEFAKAGRWVDLRHVLYGERCFGIRANPARVLRRAFRMDPVSHLLIASVFKVSGAFDTDRLWFLESMNRYIEAASRPAPQRYIITQEIEDEMHADYPRHAGFITSILFIDMSSAITWEGNTIAKMRVAEVALAVLRHKLEHGRPPQTLKDIAEDVLPAIPQDPFDFRPIHLKHENARTLIYSVGKDMVDHGGRAQLYWQKHDQPHDIALEISR
jgi:hypothetical protein